LGGKVIRLATNGCCGRIAGREPVESERPPDAKMESEPAEEPFLDL